MHCVSANVAYALILFLCVYVAMLNMLLWSHASVLHLDLMTDLHC